MYTITFHMKDNLSDKTSKLNVRIHDNVKTKNLKSTDT